MTSQAQEADTRTGAVPGDDGGAAETTGAAHAGSSLPGDTPHVQPHPSHTSPFILILPESVSVALRSSVMRIRRVLILITLDLKEGII